MAPANAVTELTIDVVDFPCNDESRLTVTS